MVRVLVISIILMCIPSLPFSIIEIVKIVAFRQVWSRQMGEFAPWVVEVVKAILTLVATEPLTIMVSSALFASHGSHQSSSRMAAAQATQTATRIRAVMATPPP
jgi:hypothetical protein